MKKTNTVEKFNTKSDIKKEIEELLLHKSQLQKPRKFWDSYAEQHQLPNANWITDLFGSWSDMKKELGLTQRNKKVFRKRKSHKTYNIKNLTTLLLEHKEELKKTKKQWKEYAKIHQLPTSYTIDKTFGSWKEMKYSLNISTTYKKKYTQENIIAKLKPYKNEITCSSVYKDVARKYKLPAIKTIEFTFGSWKNFAQALGIERDYYLHYTQQILLEKVISYQSHVTSIMYYQGIAPMYRLPALQTILRYFGTWKNFKKELERYGQENKRKLA